MKTQLKLKKEYCKFHGFEEIKGYRFDMNDCPLDESVDYYYLTEEGYKEFVKKVTYWSDDDSTAFDDIDEVIEYIEDCLDNEADNFEQWKKSRIPASQRKLG